jgi:hypothetical protein
MGVILGKPAHITFDCLDTLPLDCQVPQNWKSSVPTPRTHSQKPTPFTMRWLEYRLQKDLPKIRLLETEGPYPRDYGAVERLHQEAMGFIESIPPIYSFRNPDKSFDTECSWLASQREYLCGTSFLYVLALHKPYIFSIQKSRTEILKAGMQALYSEQRQFECLEVHQYKNFTHAYFSFEAAVSVCIDLLLNSTFFYFKARQPHDMT